MCPHIRLGYLQARGEILHKFVIEAKTGKCGLTLIS
jgi:hypothetical protein